MRRNAHIAAPHRRRRTAWLLAAAAAALAPWATSSAAIPVQPTIVIAASLTPGELPYGAAVTVAGAISEQGQGVAGVTLALQIDPYPFRGFRTVARVSSGPDGSFSFTGVHPDRNSRVRVLDEGGPARSAALAVTVDPLVAVHSHSFGPGSTRLSIRVRHTRYGGSRSVSAFWFVQARGSRVFSLAAITPTRELAPGVLYASAIIDPPSRRFHYRVCLNPSWEGAMGPPGTHGRCPDHDFVLRARDGR